MSLHIYPQPTNSLQLEPLDISVKQTDEIDETKFTSYQLEQRLSPKFRDKKMSARKFTCLVKDLFYHEMKTKPWETLAKSMLSLVGLSTIYPAAIGSWACLKTFQVTPLSELESSDLPVAMSASQNIGNTGMAITYMVQLHEFVFHPITGLFKQTYNKKVCEEIRAYYSDVLEKNKLSPIEANYLVERINKELSDYSGLPMSAKVDVNNDVTELQSVIDASIEKRLSTRRIIHLTARQMKEDTFSSSKIATKIITTVTSLGILGFCCVVLGIGTYGCYKPFDLQSPYDLASSDSKKVENAIANYANTGHGLEYVATMALIFFKTVKLLIGKHHRKVVIKQVRDAYQPSFENPELSKDTKDLLHQRMCVQIKALGS